MPLLVREHLLVRAYPWSDMLRSDAEGMRRYKESVRQRWAITLIAIKVIVARSDAGANA